jgi:alkylhydroperoxidase domain protein
LDSDVTDQSTATPTTTATESEIISYPDLDRPDRFTQEELGWVPWLPPLPADELTERHFDGLVDASRAKSPYFLLLARDPDILGARTRTDKDIFYNTKAGLPRAERELSAAATSRFNGCVFCASVHARFASHHSKRSDDVQRLLDDGVPADLGERWNAIVAASVALASTPIAFGQEHVARLRAAGLDDLEIADVIHGAAFFNWANRLMLSLGEPHAPAVAAGSAA